MNYKNDNQNKMTKAVLYLRYSMPNQNEQNIENQRKACQEYCKAKNYEIINEYIDRASGIGDNRPNFQQMIKDSEKGQFDKVVAYTIDRIGRNKSDIDTYERKLQLNGVKFEYVKEFKDPISELMKEAISSKKYE